MICADNGQPRKEWILRSNTMAAIRDDFEVYCALYGDSKSRYTDVTKTVQGWTRDGLWPENWEEVLYATREPASIVSGVDNLTGTVGDDGARDINRVPESSLLIHKAHYGIGSLEDIDVRERLQSLVRDNSLDIVVNNSTLTPNQNPFRGKKKQLNVIYSFNDSVQGLITRTVEEKDWLIIGPAVKAEAERFIAGLRDKVKLMKDESPTFKPLRPEQMIRVDGEKLAALPEGVIAGEVISGRVNVLPKAPTTALALNDYLVRKFSISPQRLRGPMPIELRDFHRNDLAQLFAELGFKRGAEIGVAEGNYSEVLLKANPECELLLVDPWHAYSDNPQNKTKEKHEFAYSEVLRKIDKYPHVRIHKDYSMNAVRDVNYGELDFCYIDAQHQFDFVVSDLVEWSKRVRSGGIVSGDDYYALDQKRWIGGGVVEAVQAYTNAHRIPVWYIFQGHKSTDFMWVKP